MSECASLRAGREALAGNPALVAAIEAVADENDCFGQCNAGRVRGAHLANHTVECAHLQLLLGDSIPADYVWNGERLVFSPGAKGEEAEADKQRQIASGGTDPQTTLRGSR